MFFSFSYAAKETLSDRVLNVTFGLLGKLTVTREMIDHALELIDTLIDPLSAFRLVVVMLAAVLDLPSLLPLLKIWSACHNQDFQNAFQSAISHFCESNYSNEIKLLCEDRLKHEHTHVLNVSVTCLNVFDMEVERADDGFEFEVDVNAEKSSKNCSGYGHTSYQLRVERRVVPHCMRVLMKLRC